MAGLKQQSVQCHCVSNEQSANKQSDKRRRHFINVLGERARVTKQHAGGERVSFVSWYITGRAAAATCCTLFQGVAAANWENERVPLVCRVLAEMDLRHPSPDTKESPRERESKESLSLLLAALLFNGGAITLMGRSAPQIYRTQFVVATPACFCNPMALAHRTKSRKTNTTHVSHQWEFHCFFCPEWKNW
jgi:hypothetical protein